VAVLLWTCVAIGLAGCKRQEVEVAASQKLPLAPLAAEVRVTAECKDNLKKLRDDYKKLGAEGKFEDAARVVHVCALLLTDTDLAALEKDADIKAVLKTEINTSIDLRERSGAVDELKKLSPEIAQVGGAEENWLVKAEQQDRAAGKKRLALDAAERRRTGVSIGMTQKDVLAKQLGAGNKRQSKHLFIRHARARGLWRQ
jgi:hypothetical protein